MPIYEFVCSTCGAQFDRLVPYDWKSAGVSCPDCGKADLQRAVSRLGGFSSEGKMTMMDAGDHHCTSCHSGHCSTCN